MAKVLSNATTNESDLYGDLDLNIKDNSPAEEGVITLSKTSLVKSRSTSGNSVLSGRSNSSISSGKVNRTVSRRASMSNMDEEGLRARVRELEEENSTLKRNISTLYRTAREEIKRKDAQIAALQEKELDSSFSQKWTKYQIIVDVILRWQ